MRPQQRDLGRKKFDFHCNDLRYLEVEANPARFAIREAHREILVVGPSCYQEEIYTDKSHSLPPLVSDTHLQHIAPQLVLRHRKVKFLLDFPLSPIEGTFRASSARAVRGSSGNSSLCRRKVGEAVLCIFGAVRRGSRAR